MYKGTPATSEIQGLAFICKNVLLDRFHRELASEVAREEMKIAAKKIRLDLLIAQANEIVLDLCEEVSNQEIKKICQFAINEVHQERERKIRELQVQ